MNDIAVKKPDLEDMFASMTLFSTVLLLWHQQAFLLLYSLEVDFFIVHYEQGKLLFILLHFPHAIMKPANFSMNCWSQHAKATPNFSKRVILFCSTCSSITSDFQSRMNVCELRSFNEYCYFPFLM